jgi:hypothetical protein
MRTSIRNCLTVLGAASALLAAAPAASAATCDRACLEGVMDKYLTAMVAHDPSKAPFAPNIRYTENTVELKLPDGLWRTSGQLGKFRLFVDDPEWGQVAVLTTGEENGSSYQLGVRLKVVDGKITEAETLVYRHSPDKADGGLAALAPNLQGDPRPQFTQTIPANKRLTREQLIDINDAYWEGIELNDGSQPPPFADDCHRYEGGRATTNKPVPPGEKPNAGNMSCKDAFAAGYYREDTRIRDRRYLAVDVERGLVFQSVFMDHDAAQFRHYKLNNGGEVTVTKTAPWNWYVQVVIQVNQDGKISQIEGLPLAVLYGLRPNWDTGVKRATKIQDGPTPW